MLLMTDLCFHDGVLTMLARSGKPLVISVCNMFFALLLHTNLPCCCTFLSITVLWKDTEMSMFKLISFKNLKGAGWCFWLWGGVHARIFTSKFPSAHNQFNLGSIFVTVKLFPCDKKEYVVSKFRTPKFPFLRSQWWVPPCIRMRQNLFLYHPHKGCKVQSWRWWRPAKREREPPLHLRTKNIHHDQCWTLLRTWGSSWLVTAVRCYIFRRHDWGQIEDLSLDAYNLEC